MKKIITDIACMYSRAIGTCSLSN